MRRQVLVLIALLGACDRGDRGAKPRAAPAASAAGPAHHVEATAAACRAGDACTLAVKLTALRDFHVNPDYPFKFVPTPSDGVTLEPGVFTREGDQQGTMTVGFRAAAAGSVQVTGKLRLSVCNDDECRIEEEPISVQVAIGG